jgi:hypothetical protein
MCLTAVVAFLTLLCIILGIVFFGAGAGWWL